MGGLVPQNNYESAGQPRGGGWGLVRNLTFENFDVTGAEKGTLITQNQGNNGSFSGMSKMAISDIHYKNFHGTLSGADNLASIVCSNVTNCDNLWFTNMTLLGSFGTTFKGSCWWVKPGGIHGLRGCS